MIFGEKTKRTLDWDADGKLVGKMEFKCGWGDVDPVLHPDLPQPGDCWGARDVPSVATIPFLKVKHIHAEEDRGALCDFSVDFANNGDLVGDPENPGSFVTEECEPGQFVMPDMAGWVWFGLQTPVDGKLPEPCGDPIGIDQLVQTSPNSMLKAARWCVNDRKFRGYETGTLLFCGATTKHSYGWGNELLEARVAFKFLHKAIPYGSGVLGHNYFWRAPVQMRDKITMQPLYYHDLAGRYGYTSSTALLYTPIYYPGPLADGTYQAPSDQGIGGYDVPIYTDPVTLESRYLFPFVDFGTLLGIPILDGDDAIG